jgi:tRNA(Ile)-lysidine synthase
MSVTAIVRQTMHRHGMLAADDRALVAVSGGQDSVCLLHLLHAFAVERGGPQLEVAHLNHGLRGEDSDADQAFVESTAALMGLPIHVGKVDVASRSRQSRTSVEVAGRAARQAFFEGVLQERGLNKLALGHTASDRLETLLMNVFRGCGLHGLRSIPAVSGRIVRPLIGVTRQETEGYCRKHHLEFRTDRSNLDPEHTLRNKIRLQLLPLLRAEYATGIDNSLLRLADIAQDELEWTEPLVGEALHEATDGDGRLDARAMDGLPGGLANRVSEEYLRQVSGTEDIGRIQVEQLTALLLRGHTGQQMPLPGGLTARRAYGRVEVGPADGESAGAARTESMLARRIRLSGVTRIPELGIRVEARESPVDPSLGDEARRVAVFDADALGNRLWVRTWRPGDRFRPLGAPGSRKLQDFFVDAKVPQQERARVPLLVGPQNRIVWVAGYRIAEDAKVNSQTSRCRIVSMFVE